MKGCSNCQSDCPDAAVFCKFCGATFAQTQTDAAASVIQPRVPCPQCRTMHRADAVFCKQCGTRFAAPGRSPVVAASHDPQTGVTGNAGFLNAFRTTGGKAAVVAVALVVLLIVLWISRGVRVSFAATTDDVRLFVDDNQISNRGTIGDPYVVYLSRGRHTVRAERTGYKEWTQNLDLSITDFSKEVKITLEPAVFTLTLLTTPASSRVLLNDQEKGYSDAREGKLVVADVALGKHSITIQHDGYEDWTQTVSVDSAQLIRAQLTEKRQISSDENEIIRVLQDWAESIQAADLSRHMDHYAETLEKYYNLTNVNASKVRDDRAKAFAKYTSLEVSLSNFNIQFDGSSERVIAVFDKNFDFQGTKYYSGAVQNKITLARIGEGWKIIGEEELQVYNVNSGGT